jgi:plastocyanin
VTVAISLINYPDMSSAYGMVGGFSPALVVVASGTVVQFHNQDGFDHTASGIPGSSFPGGTPIPFSALTPSGSDVSQAGWSTGLLVGGSYSRTFTTSTVGQYLFGCYYHYSSGMRGVIIVQ